MAYDLEKYPMKPDVVAFLEKVDSSYPPHSGATNVEEGRRAYGILCAAFDTPIPDGVTIADDTVAGRSGPIAVRIYDSCAARSDVTVIYYHGGGFVLGDLDTHNTICADLAQATGYRIIAVDYRLAPEHVYPAQVEDALDAFEALDQGRTIVCGDSAGGTLAAAVSVACRTGPKRPIAQILIYPFVGGEIFGLPSYEENADAPLLTRKDVHYFEDLRSGGAPASDDPLYFPLVQPDFSGMPPCSAFAAEHDPIRDDAVEYVRKLSSAGISAECVVEAGLVHGFLRGRHVSASIGESFERICKAIRTAGESAQRAGQPSG